MILTAVELAEVAKTALSDTEAKYGKMRPVSDEALLGWASYAIPKLEEMLAREYEAHATHPDFLMVSDEEQEQLHADTNEEVVRVLVDSLVAQVWKLS